MSGERPRLSCVIVGCARSCAGALPAALANIDTIAALYDEAAIVLVENDSDDETPSILQHWCAARPGARLVRLDGLAERMPERTSRIAAARNACIEAIDQGGLGGCDHLIVIDLDEVNERAIDPDDFARARGWLQDHEDVAAVFSNATPVYYDILALRHPTWAPGDMWAEVRRHTPELGKAEARRRFTEDRQVPIPRTADPIEVQSAFGGLGIYKLRHALEARYEGLDADGVKVCEHVAFNRAVAEASGGRLYILPWLQTGRTTGVGVALPEMRRMELQQSGRTSWLMAPTEHPLDRFRARHPLYDRRLPLLARLLGEAAPGSAILDVGANIGDTIALCRLEGCGLRFLAIEAALVYLKFLLLNRIKRPQLLEDVDPVWAFVGKAGGGALELHDGTARLAQDAAVGEGPEAPVMSLEAIAASAGLGPDDIALVKIDTDGQDQSIILGEFEWLKRTAPVLWTETDISRPAQQEQWARILNEGAEAWPYLVAFDNFGFAYAAGATAEKAGSCLDLIAYARRRKVAPRDSFGPPTVFYTDLALFPARFAPVFEAFRALLPELAL
jgi:FkbM family methyltransferase